MFSGVADTHAALWHLFDDPRLSFSAADFIDRAAAAGQTIAVSSISLAELIYLTEKNRLPFSAYDEVRRALADPSHVLKEAPFTVDIAEAMRRVACAEIPDMPD